MPVVTSDPIGLSYTVANNVRMYAAKRRLNHETLAAQMTAQGFPMKRAGIAAITGQRRLRVSVDETAAFARIFDVSFEDMLAE